MKVDYCVIGEQKCGTTWIYKNLYGHPELHFIDDSFASKELQLFRPEKKFMGVRNSNTRKLSGVQGIVGDFTPEYLVLGDGVIKAMYDNNPNMKIIIMLRNPLERALSQYNMQKNFNNPIYSILGKMSFEEAFIKDYPRDNMSIKKRTQYAKNIKKYIKNFDTKIIFLEDVKSQPEKVIVDVCDFLGIKPVTNENINKRIFSVKNNVTYTGNTFIKTFINDEIKELEKLLDIDLVHYKI